ncbi:MAG TPA: hypothetical protein DEQ34_07080 [Balneolaceae bacterium]|nr:hypothetical protein [Balneolaceae bacterium]|tara:strand:- start:187222 stop:188976 length:1755 start_codon:yes stop_codon:yes gene_type:complete
MAKGKEYIGISLDGLYLKVATVRIAKNQMELVKLDRFSLISRLERVTTSSDDNVFDDLDNDLADEGVFDIDLDAALDSPESVIDEISIEDEILGDLGDDLTDDLDLEIDELEQRDDLIDVDMVDEAEEPVSNELLLYNILSAHNPKKVNIGLNIPSGVAVYQILKDADFSEMKKKDLKVVIDDRLESLYGSPKEEDYYSYGVRPDGALLLSSIDEDSQLLQLVNRTMSMYRGKIVIEEILPDETVLLGLIKANYEIEDGGITCVVQFSEQQTRIFFLKDSNLWLVSPVITEGTRSKKILSTVFSKVLFQLDTGEVPNLDRLIICNNLLGNESVTFFQERFPDVEVSEFEFEEDFLDVGEYTQDSLAPFTTAIGTAWSATGYNKKALPEISFVPKYVVDRQKIFKLQWHGILLLILIMISFPITNEFWQRSFRDINRLENEISILNTQIQTYQPIVNNFNRISNELSLIQDKLVLMNTLTENSITWSTNLDLINSGVDEVNDLWITSVSQGEEPNTLEIQGIARYQSRVHIFADIFADATLLNVSSDEIRGVEVFNFSYQVNKIVENTSVYTPKDLQSLEELTGN